jgi:hypothetical protein
MVVSASILVSKNREYALSNAFILEPVRRSNGEAGDAALVTAQRVSFHFGVSGTVATR